MNRRGFFGTVAGVAAACGLDYSVLPAIPAAEPEPVAKPAASGFTVLAKDDRGHVTLAAGNLDAAARSGEVFATGGLLIVGEHILVNESFDQNMFFRILPHE